MAFISKKCHLIGVLIGIAIIAMPSPMSALENQKHETFFSKVKAKKGLTIVSSEIEIDDIEDLVEVEIDILKAHLINNNIHGYKISLASENGGMFLDPHISDLNNRKTYIPYRVNLDDFDIKKLIKARRFGKTKQIKLTSNSFDNEVLYIQPKMATVNDYIYLSMTLKELSEIKIGNYTDSIIIGIEDI